jgi:NAD(P)-dependent dehydrogenase (short-subunit alcohol dehydrogenase family)
MKYVLVTGACGGMGKATVDALESKGFGVIGLDRVKGEERENVFYIECDVTSEESVQCAMQKVGKITDELFAIVHYAGIYMLDSLVELSGADFERIFRVNTFGAFYVNKAFVPMLKKGSRIVITTSELAPLDPLPFTGIYAITKSALDKYAYSLRMELQLMGIDVCVLRAGAVNTEMLGVSTTALNRFCDSTELYKFSSKRFKRVVDRVEARHVHTSKIASKTLKILGKRRTKFAYSINRNPLLILLNLLPKRIQLFAIRKILK